MRIRDPQGRFLANSDLLQIGWARQSEECGEPGILLTEEAGFNAERVELKRQGAPDTEHIEYVDECVQVRDESEYIANVTVRTIAWMTEQRNQNKARKSTSGKEYRKQNASLSA